MNLPRPDRKHPSARSHAARVDLEQATDVAEVIPGLRRYGVTEEDIATALGVSSHSVRDWAQTSVPSREHGEQIWMLREIALILRETLTPRGVGQWFRAPNRFLRGRRPIKMLAEDADAVRASAASYVQGAYV